MDWHKIAFPEDVYPFSEPHVLETEAQEIYRNNNFPEGFAVYMEFDDSHSRIYYFNPVACGYCVDLFKSYRGSYCDDPRASGRTVAQIIP